MSQKYWTFTLSGISKLCQIYDPLKTETLLTIDSNNITRTNTLKLKKNRVNYLPYQKFVTNRVITNRNRLSRDIVRAETLNSFKNKLDNKLRDLKFQTNINQNYHRVPALDTLKSCHLLPGRWSLKYDFRP